MYHSIQLPIFNKKRRLANKIGLVLFIIFAIGVVLNIINGDKSGKGGIILLIAFCLLIIYAIIFIKYDFIGTITIEQDKIKIKFNSMPEKAYSLNEISDIIIEYNNYKDKQYYTPQPFSSAGIDNYICFSFFGEDIRNKVLIKYSDIIQLNNLFTIWKNREISFKIKSGKELIDIISV